uniref:RRM domain-containing protein n=1 Tax=Steinernema glaseri TaxID=37863 RepID=A0A1I7YQA3_9BILA
MASGSMIVRLKYLPNSAKAMDIRQFFMGIKIPDGAVHIIGGPTGDAFIGFTNKEDGDRALKLTGGTIQGSSIVLSTSSKEEMERVLEDAYRGFGQPPAHGTQMQGKPSGPMSRAPLPQQHQGSYHEKMTEREANYHQNIPTASESRDERVGDRYTWNSRQGPQEPYRPDHYAPGSRHPRDTLESERESLQHYSSGRSPPGYRPSGPDHRRDHPENNYQPSTNDSWSRGPAGAGHDRYGPSATDRFNGPPGSERFNGPPSEERFDGPPQGRGPPGDRFNGPPGPNAFGAPSQERFGGPPGPGSDQYNNLERRPDVDQERMPRGEFREPYHPGQEARRAPSPDRCVEITNLPPDLLRPTAMESFIRPMTPLTLSSVKMVQDQSGRPVALVRFPNPADLQHALRLDGTRNVYIRPISNVVFEKAVEAPLTGPPVPRSHSPVSPSHPPSEDTWRSHGPPAQAPGYGGPPGRPFSPPRRGRSRSPQRRERDRRPDLDPRSRFDKERSPPRRRRTRSRSPLRRRETSVSSSSASLTPSVSEHLGARYDVLITNVPFKVTIAQWEDFAAHNGVRYVNVTRTYYEDGNASDRWVMTFTSREDAMRLLAADRTPLGSMGGRSLRMRAVSAEEAIHLMSIPDKFGELRKEEYDRQRGKTEEDMIREGELPPTAFGAFSVARGPGPRPSKPGLLGPPNQNRPPPNGPGPRGPRPAVPSADPERAAVMNDERAAVTVGKLIDGPPTDMQMKIAKQLMMSGITPTKADLEAAANFGDRPAPSGPGARHYRPEMNGNMNRPPGPPRFFNPRGHGPRGGPRPSRYGARNY